MIRYVLIALLVLLHAQFAWSAVAKYCGHEVTSTFSHLGHHSHQHQADLPSPFPSESDLADGSILYPHSDCGFCQSLVAPIVSASKAIQTEQNTEIGAGYTTVLYTSAVSNDIERPKWTLLGALG